MNCNIDMDTITRVVDFYMNMNEVNVSDGIHFEFIEYDDNYFRWKKDSFKKPDRVLVFVHNNRIDILGREKVLERLRANVDKVKSDADGNNHGCKMEVVRDIVVSLKIEEYTEADADSWEKARLQAKEIREFNEEIKKKYEVNRNIKGKVLSNKS